MFQKSGPLAIGQVFWKKAPFLIFVPSQLGNRGFFHGFIPAEFWRCSTEKNPWKSSFPKSIGWRWSFPTYQTWPHDPPSFVSRLGRLPGSRLSSSKLTSLNLNVRKVKFWGEAPPKTDRYKWGDRLYHPYKLVFFHPPVTHLVWPSFVGYDSWHVHKLLGIWGLGRKTATSFCWSSTCGLTSKKICWFLKIWLRLTLEEFLQSFYLTFKIQQNTSVHTASHWIAERSEMLLTNKIQLY